MRAHESLKELAEKLAHDGDCFAQRVSGEAPALSLTGCQVAVVRHLGVTPHVTQNVTGPGGSAIDRRMTRHPGYGHSQHAAAH